MCVRAEEEERSVSLFRASICSGEGGGVRSMRRTLAPDGMSKCADLAWTTRVSVSLRQRTHRNTHTRTHARTRHGTSHAERWKYVTPWPRTHSIMDLSGGPMPYPSFTFICSIMFILLLHLYCISGAFLCSHSYRIYGQLFYSHSL